MRTVVGVFLLVMIGIVGCASQFVKPRQTVRNAEMTGEAVHSGKGYKGLQPLVRFEQRDLFVSGTEGYHTFRIPALAVTKKGTLLAFCEGRKRGRDDSGAIDTVLRRSTDNGHSWGPLEVVGAGGEDTCGNPCPITVCQTATNCVDRRTGAVLLLLTKNKGAVNESMIMRGEAPPRTVWIARSMDDGVTWSAPEEISEQARKPEWRWYATGPGHGIQLANGRLVAPCDHSLGPDWHSHVIYSDDTGASWRIGGVAEGNTDESTVVELFDGTLYLNMRNNRTVCQATTNRDTHRRAFATSTDKGLTWSPVGDDPALVEPVCQASVLRLSTEKHRTKNRIVFSNPASERRENMTVRLSYDQCKTWSVAKTLWPGPSAYSDLVLAADKRIGCLYERGRNYPYETVTFALFTLEWLTEGRDRL